MSIFTQSIILIRPGERQTRGGDTVTDWSPAAVTRTTIEHLSVQPNFQQENPESAGNSVRSDGLRVLSDPAHPVPDVDGLDRFEYRGTVYAVDGDVAFWPDPHGRDHIEFVATAWKGA